MRLHLALLLGFVTAFGCGAGRGQGRRAAVPQPTHTLTQLKRAVARRDRAAEWSTLSPAFKERLNQRMGRVIDLADYTHYRGVQMRDRRVREAESALRTATVRGVRRMRGGYARVTIWFGGPLFFGKAVNVRMVNLARWELGVHGEAQPYWGFANDRTMTARRLADGGFVVTTHGPDGSVAWQHTVPAEKVRSFRRRTAWYFDHLGELERFFG